MLIALILAPLIAIGSFFSLPLEDQVVLEEKLFPPLIQEEDADFYVKYNSALPNGNFQEYLIGLLFQKMIELELSASPHLFLHSPPSFSTLSIGCGRNERVAAKKDLFHIIEKIKGEGFSSKSFEKAKQLTQEAMTPQMGILGEVMNDLSLSAFSPIILTLTIDQAEVKKNRVPMRTAITTSETAEAYFKLPLNDTEKKLIYKIITTIADKNPLKLALEKKSLDKKGKRIHQVHPLRFLGYIFSEHRLKSSMKEIRKSHFKWDAFINGLSKKMKEESHRDNLFLYVPGFCEHLNANPDHVMHYLRKHDWEGLVRHLL
jgi:hypothetical protein